MTGLQGTHPKRKATRGLVFTLLLAAASATVFQLPPATHAYYSDTYGPYEISWSWAFWGNAVPGQTVTFSFFLANLNDVWVNLNDFLLVMPWGNYYPSNLPIQVNHGYYYNYEVNVTIPQDQALGTLDYQFGFMGSYYSGVQFCASTQDVCVESGSIVVMADPVPLQTQVLALTQNVTALQSKVSSLNSQVATLSDSVSTLTQSLAQAHANVTATRQELSTTQAQLQSVQNDLVTAKAQLNVTSSQLSLKQAQLTDKTNQLASTQNVYLPLAAGIPSILAVLLAVMYVRKRPMVSRP